jgi:ABC-type Na+ efflux pump permease subunit
MRAIGRIKVLTANELKRSTTSRASLISATVAPVLLLAAVPLPLIIFFGTLPMSALPIPASLALRLLALRETSQVLTEIVLPVLVLVAGLAIPLLTAVQLVIAEREQRSFELLAALPVTITDLFVAKFLSTGLLALGISLPLLALQAIAIAVFLSAPWSAVAMLLALLLAGLLCSTGTGLLVALVARDGRMASNLNGLAFAAVLGAVWWAMTVIEGPTKFMVISAGLVGMSALAVLVALRFITFESYLRS